MITDELINERLEAKGFGKKQSMDYELCKQSVLNHYGVKFTDDWDNALEGLVSGDTSAGFISSEASGCFFLARALSSVVRAFLSINMDSKALDMNFLIIRKPLV